MISQIFNQERKKHLRFLTQFYLANACLFFIIGLRYLIFILNSNSLYNNFWSSYPTLAGKCFVLFFVLATYLGHMTLLSFLPYLLIALPVTVFIDKKWVILSTSIVTASIAIILFIIDSIIFPLFHFHLNYTLVKIFFNKEGLDLIALSINEILGFSIIILLIFFLEIIIAYFIWNKSIIRHRIFPSKKILFGLFTSLFFSYSIFILSINYNNNLFAQITPNLPLYNQILAKLILNKKIVNHFSETQFHQSLYPGYPLHYPLNPLYCSSTSKPLNIVIIGIDTWRFDAVDKSVTPNITQFASHVWDFKNHFSGGNGTHAGLFSLFYSIPLNTWDSILKYRRGPLFFHELLKQNYQIKIYANNMTTVPAFDKTLFTEIKEAKMNYLPAKSILERDIFFTHEFTHFLNSENAKKPFFAFIFYNITHNYCESNIPNVFSQPNDPCLRFKRDKLNIKVHLNHYNDAVHFVDSEISQILTSLKENHLLENTVILITGDHGEEFDDNKRNFWGHSSNYTRYQIQVPLFIYWPGRENKIFTHQTTHYDIIPTLMKEVLGCRNPISDYSIGMKLLDNHQRPFVLVGSYNNMGILQKESIITLQTSGDISVTNDKTDYIPYTKSFDSVIADALRVMHQYLLKQEKQV